MRFPIIECYDILLNSPRFVKGEKVDEKADLAKPIAIFKLVPGKASETFQLSHPWEDLV
jgi:hypothetical protein